MSSKTFTTLLLTLLIPFYSSCQTGQIISQSKKPFLITQSERPDWISGKGHSDYPQTLYLVGVGVSNKNSVSANDSARLNLAKNLKVKIDLDEYIDTIKKDKIKNYSSLDVIGDPEKTLKNYLYMKSKDLEPVPCFHINTDIDYLDYYLKESDRLAIGGIVQAKNIEVNLKKIWSKILNKNNKTKVHGFGISNPEIAVNYPWYSIDSSSFNCVTKFSRASEWNSQINNFDILNSFDLLQTMSVDNKDKQIQERKTLGGVIHNFLFFWQMEQYNQMIDWVNKKQKHQSWEHLTAQISMF